MKGISENGQQDEPLARIGADGSIRYYLADALGSIIALADENGVVKTRYNYSPFGITEETGEASDNPFKFTGREDDGTGLYYYRARYYSPEMGRFISEDPIGFAGGDVNWYAYVNNSPLNWIDPLGLILWYGDKNSEQIFRQYILLLMKSPAGRQLLKRLHGDDTIYTIYALDCKGLHPDYCAFRVGNNIFIDPCFHPTIQTDQGPKETSTARILAHELGHVEGKYDKLDQRMKQILNIIEYENPIMLPLEGYSRTIH